MPDHPDHQWWEYETEEARRERIADLRLQARLEAERERRRVPVNSDYQKYFGPPGFPDAVPVLKGHLKLEVYEGDPVKDDDGNILNKLVEVAEYDNLVVTTGKNLYLDRLFALGTPPAAVNSMGVGATATAAVVGDTQLGSTPTIKAFDSLPVRAGLVVTCVTTFLTTDANISWNEIGLFNGTVNGTSIMFNHIAPIGPFAKTSAVSIVATITVTAT